MTPAPNLADCAANVVAAFAALAALDVAIAQFPDEDTPVLQYIDRLLELGYSWFAGVVRMNLTLRQYQRLLFQSLGVPAHVLRGEPAPPSPNGELPCTTDSPTAPARR